MVHAGEMIQPAQGTGPYTGPQGSGSSNVSFQISALDGASVQAFFQKNAAQIARVLSGHMNQNPSFS